MRRSILALTCLLLAGLSSQAYAQSVTVQFSAATYSVVEGNAAQLEVVLSAARAVDTTVRMTTIANSATSVADFDPGPYDVTIPAGQTRATVSISTVEDTNMELDEQFTVVISPPHTDVPVGSQGTASVTILDDDHEYTVSFQLGSYIISEGETSRIPVDLSRALREDTTITFTYTDLSAVPGTDYIPVDSVIVPAGETTAYLAIRAPDNTLFDENTLVTVQATSANPVSGAQPAITSIIVRSDEIIELVSDPDITVVAGRPLQIKARRLPGPGTEPITLPIEWVFGDSGAPAPADFAPGPRQIIIPAGHITGAVVIPTIADEDTTTETFNQVTVNDPIGNFKLLNITVYPVTNPEPSVSIAANAESITEGAGATFTVTATPAPPENMDVYVRYGQIGGDFLATEPDEAVAVTIAANNNTGTLSLTTKADKSNNSGRIDAVLLDRHDTPSGSASYPYTVRGSKSAASIAVMDGPDVPELKVKLLLLSPRTVEEGTALRYYLNVNFAPESDLPVNLSIREGPGTFAPGGDYVAADTWTATIPAGERGVAFSIPTVDDGVEEPNAIVRVRIEACALS